MQAVVRALSIVRYKTLSPLGHAQTMSLIEHGGRADPAMIPVERPAKSLPSVSLLLGTCGLVSLRKQSQGNLNEPYVLIRRSGVGLFSRGIKPINVGWQSQYRRWEFQVRLRVLDFGSVSALRSQAVYHGVAQAFQPGDEPVLTLVNPIEPYICVGMHQDVGLEVDEDFCRSRGLPIIRRQVGGGAVYLDHNQMFFHFIYPPQRVPRHVADIYPMFINPVVRTYRAMGIPADLRPINDIHVNGRKIGGTGAATIGHAVVMVGSFLFDFDTETMARCLKVPSEKFRDKLRVGLNDYMSTMRKELDSLPRRADVKALFLEHIAQTLGVTPYEDAPTPVELDTIAAQEQELSDPEWTYQLGRKFVQLGVKIAAGTHLTESAYKAPGGLIRVQLLEKDDSIADVIITGDFSGSPEGGMFDLATRIKGARLDAASLELRLGEEMAAVGVDIPGVTAADLAAAILSAVHKEAH